MAQFSLALARKLVKWSASGNEGKTDREENKIVISRAYIFLSIKLSVQKAGQWVLFCQVNPYYKQYWQPVRVSCVPVLSCHVRLTTSTHILVRIFIKVWYTFFVWHVGATFYPTSSCHFFLIYCKMFSHTFSISYCVQTVRVLFHV